MHIISVTSFGVWMVYGVMSRVQRIGSPDDAKVKIKSLRSTLTTGSQQEEWLSFGSSRWVSVSVGEWVSG